MGSIDLSSHGTTPAEQTGKTIVTADAGPRVDVLGRRPRRIGPPKLSRTVHIYREETSNPLTEGLSGSLSVVDRWIEGVS